MNNIKRISLGLIIFLIGLTCFAQEPAGSFKKIKIKKNTFVKAVFDESNYKIVAFDKYGNPYEDAIKSFEYSYQTKKGGINVIAQTGNTISDIDLKKLQKEINKTNKVFFENIKAQASDSSFVTLPPIEYIFYQKNSSSR